MNSHQKKICFIVSSPNTAKAFLKDPIRALAKNYTIYLVVNASTSSLPDLDFFLEKIHSINIKRDINPYYDLKALLKLILFFKKNKFNIIHSISPKAGLLAMCAGYFAKTPSRVHTFTGQVWYSKKGFFRILLKNIDRLIVCFSTNILVDGQSQKEFLISQNIVKNNTASVLEKGSICGIDSDKFLPITKKKTAFREKYSVLENEIVLMFLGRLNLDKGVVDLILAFQKLRKHFLNIKLFLIGTDEAGIEKKMLLKKQSLEGIFFTGYAPNPEEVLQGTDIFCLPSYREGFGMSVIEAEALEKAVVCSDTYGLRDTLIDGVTGLKHKTGDIDDLFLKLKILIENPTQIKQMGKAGRTYVKETFEQTKIINAWEEYYKVIVKKQNRLLT